MTALLASTARGQSIPAGLPTTCSAYASVPLPAEAAEGVVPKSYPSCASYRSYRGIGRPVNFPKARTCAWRERLAQKAELGQNPAEPTALIVGGSLILADMYFNGAGVKKNIPLAMRLACESEEGMAMLALHDITSPKFSASAHTPFEFCDYAVTTMTMDFCVSYASEIDDARRNRYYGSLKSSMTPAQQAAFTKLVAAKDTYINAHASEVYQGGTIRAIRTTGSQDILENLFHTELVHFERGKWPELSENQVRVADTLLQQQYAKTLKQLSTQSKESIDDGAVTADHLASVEQIWKNYRDAWVAFAALRYPEHVAGIRAAITLDRYRLLKTI